MTTTTGNRAIETEKSTITIELGTGRGTSTLIGHGGTEVLTQTDIDTERSEVRSLMTAEEIAFDLQMHEKLVWQLAGAGATGKILVALREGQAIKTRIGAGTGMHP